MVRAFFHLRDGEVKMSVSEKLRIYFNGLQMFPVSPGFVGNISKT